MGIYRRGRIWYLRTKQGGREVRLAVGPSKRQAELALGKVKTEMAEGRFIEPKNGSQRVRSVQFLRSTRSEAPRLSA